MIRSTGNVRHLIGLTTVVFASIQSVGIAQTYDIKPLWKANRMDYIELSQKITQRFKGPTGDMKFDIDSIYGVLQKTKEVKDGGAVVELTWDRLKSFNSMMDGSFDTDDPDNEESAAPMRSALNPIIGQVLSVTFDSANAVTRFEGANKIQEALQPEVKANNTFAMMLGQREMSEGRLKITWAEAPMAAYPGHPVKIGDTWEKKIYDDIPRIGKAVTTYNCKLDRVDDKDGKKTAFINCVAVTKLADEAARAKGDEKKDDAPKSSIKGESKGIAEYDFASGMITRRKLDGGLDITMAGPMKMDIHVDSSMSMQVLSIPERRKEQIDADKKATARKDAARIAKAAKSTEPIEPPTKANAPVAWTQWGGPDRDFISGATGLVNQWPIEGPHKLWSREMGDGYSAILVEGDTLYTMYSIRDKKDANIGTEYVIAMEADTGKTKWEYKYEAPWPKDKDMQMEFGPGPHSTPVIAGDRLITIGTTAKMHCLDKSTGKVIWEHDLLKDYNADLMNRGYGSSPVVHDDTVLLPIGGKGQAIVAWKLSDGKEAWKGGDYGGTYASLAVIKFGGQPQLLAFEGKEVCGLEIGTGKTLWSNPHKTQYEANISTPVYGKDGKIFVSSAYGMGSRGVQLISEGGKFNAKELWFNPKMKIHHANAVRIGDVVYASSGDFGPAFLAAVDINTGEFLWKERGFSKANVLAADGKLIILDEDGNLAIGKATPEKFTLLGKAQLLKKTAWTVPTISGTRLFLRDREKIMAIDLGPNDKAS